MVLIHLLAQILVELDDKLGSLGEDKWLEITQFAIESILDCDQQVQV